jgi:hypothetical protein
MPGTPQGAEQKHTGQTSGIGVASSASMSRIFGVATKAWGSSIRQATARYEVSPLTAVNSCDGCARSAQSRRKDLGGIVSSHE